MVRSINDSSAENRQKIEAMKAKGAVIVEGDLMQPETLLPACAGVDVVVSAIGNKFTRRVRLAPVYVRDGIR